MHGIPKNGCRRTGIGGRKPARSAAGFTRARRGAATKAGAVLGPKTAISRDRKPRTVCQFPACAYLDGHDRPFPVPEHLCGAAGELFRPGGADPGGRPAADQAEPAAGASSSASIRTCWTARKAPKSSPASACPTAPTRSRWPMPATSSAISCPSSATAAPSCSARSSTPTASAATSSSRARARRRFRAGATAAPRSVRCCANTSSARRCSRWASRPRARSPPSSPASACSARPCCPARC